MNLVQIYTQEDIEKRVNELATQIDYDYFSKENFVIVGVLKGSFIFMADLSRAIHLPHTIDFISIESYGMSGDAQGEVRLLLDTKQNIAGKNVLLVEDIVDSGNTIRYIMQILNTRGAKSIKVCTLLKREGADDGGVVNYCGFVVPLDKWLVGYGLDYKEEHRTLPNICYIKNLEE